MKTTFYLITFCLLLSNCKKSSDAQDPTPTTIAAPSKLAMLTNKQWLYSEIYYNATAPRVGTLAYKRGAANNTENRDNTRAFFWRNGTFDEVAGPNSSYSTLTWRFSNTDSTQYTIGTGTSLTTVNIIKLDENTFEWYTPSSKISAVMFSRL